MDRKKGIMNRLFLKICIFCVAFMFMAFYGSAQPYTYTVCPQKAESEFMPELYQDGSDGACRHENFYWIESITGDDFMIESSEVVRDGDNDPYRAKVIIHWKTNAPTGVVHINVWSTRYLTCGCFDICRGHNDLFYTLTIRRESTSPGGTLLVTGGSDIVSNSPDGGENVNLFYVPIDPVNGTKIKYWNGTTYSEKTVPDDMINGAIPITYRTSKYGQNVFTSELVNACGDPFTGSTQIINVYPSCYRDSNGALGISGTPFDPEGYLVEKDKAYAIVNNDVTDFSSHYSYFVDVGSQDIQFGEEYTFKLLSGLGSYRIGASRNSGRELCPEIAPMKIFAGGRDVTIADDCFIVLPDDLVGKGYVNPNDPSVREHFAANVISKKGIIVEPGMTLAMGAELELKNPDGLPLSEDPEHEINFVNSVSYDEYGRISGETRNYFDDLGRSVQTQVKNLDAGVILASQPIYDEYGRSAITTLSAPVYTTTQVNDGCEGQEDIMKSLTFKLKPDFVTDGQGNPYGYVNFDGVKKENPDPVQNSQKGTLGWYYSTANGNLPESDPNAPMQDKGVAATSYPYSRTIFNPDESGEVKSVTRPGDAFKAGGGHIASTEVTPVDENDMYLDSYLDIREAELGLSRPASVVGNFFRTISYDESNRKSVSYSDRGGMGIISLYYGSPINPTPIMTSYHFYNDVGQLIVSVSPNGVEQYESHAFNEIDKTTYTYDFIGRLIQVEETDSGIKKHIYREDGKIRFSQNAEQVKTGAYSYTNYDRAGRPLESGQYTPVSIAFGSTAMTDILENTLSGGGLLGDGGTYADRFYTFYDQPDINIVAEVSRVQQFVKGAVSYSENEHSKSWYSYDEQGRMVWMAQKIIGFEGAKTLDYHYGPTGAVQDATYQKERSEDRFTHYYEYDVNGRLSRAYTTREAIQYNKFGKLSDPSVLDLRAAYGYYVHGPLKRVEYANQLQGIDYAYTADGLLKSINHHDPALDPGGDGLTNEFRSDIFGLTLDYHVDDYTSATPSTPLNVIDDMELEEQFSGQIKAARWHSPAELDKQVGYAYSYDNRYQFHEATWIQAIEGTNTQFQPMSAYKEGVGYYDLNGNIKSLARKGNMGLTLADFTYNYDVNTNKLTSITKSNNDVFRNYRYNAIGQTIEQEDVGEEKKMFTIYDVAGKVRSIRNQGNNLMVSFDYDDRGFRLSKTSYDDDGEPKLKTWYVRDLGGNLMSSYEDKYDGNSFPQSTEMPIYAAGRIGLYKPQPQYGFAFYEVADHLGNVRGVIGEKTTLEYLATMETMEGDRTLEEESDFIIPAQSAPSATFINHTPQQVSVNDKVYQIANPNEVIRINNALDQEKHPVGAGILLWVHPGDKINAEVFAKYHNFDNSNSEALPAVGNYLAYFFNPSEVGIDGASIFAELNAVPTATGLLHPLAELKDEFPKAFLSYVLFDKDYALLDFDCDQVTGEAEITEVPNDHQRLNKEITIRKEGYIYVYVANLSEQNVDVYFDDLKITHELSDIVAGGDYYPYGLEISDRQIEREDYRFGYQGKFAEKDKETGFNHFTLREYDPVIGRWTGIDPKRQFSSPYIGMGNNPVNGIDPDGAWKKEFSAKFWNTFIGGTVEQYQGGKKSGEYYISRGNALASYSFNETTNEVSVVSKNISTDAAAIRESLILRSKVGYNAWNSPAARMIVPDFASVGVGYSGIAGVGASTSFEVNWVLHGPQASWLPMITTTESIGVGFDVGATGSINAASYLGDASQITRDMIPTNSAKGDRPAIFASGSVSALGKLGLSSSYNFTDEGYGIIGRGISAGFGAPAGPVPANVAVGVSNQFLIHDFYHH